MAVNKRLLQGAAAAPGGITPSEHFGVVLYEGDGKSGRSVNGGKYGAGAAFGIEKSTTQATDSRITTTYYAKNVGSISGWLKKNGNTSELEYVFVTKDDTGSAHQLGINLLQEADSDLSARVGNGSSTTNVNTSGLTLNNDAWHHFVVTWNLPNGSNNVKVYVDGSLQATGSQSTGSWTGNSSRTFQLGHYTNTNTNNGFAGMQDQVRVFEKELSSSEVSTLYAETVDTVESLDPLSEDTTDTLQVLGDSSCIATYRFENNEDDLSGNYNGTGAAIQYTAGRYGQAASFNGSDSYISTTLDLKDLSYVSISFWAYWDSNVNGIVIGGDGNDGASGYKSNRNTIALNHGSSRFDYVSYGGDLYRHAVSLSDGWHHFAISDNGGTANDSVDMYVNGSSVSYTTPVTDSNYSNHENMQIGRSRNNAGDIANYYDNKLDQIRIFNKAISAAEVTTLYNENSLVASYRFEGNANDDTRNYDGTASNVSYEYGLNFTPDFVWIKKRDATENHRLYDSTRGVSSSTNTLYPSLTFAASTESPNGLASLDTGGFTVQNQNAVNSNGNDFVAWCLKANGGTTSSNTDGTITSTVQVNDTAGFSIVKYTGNNTANATIGHGLSSSPQLIISKNLDNGSAYWATYHHSIGITRKFYLNDNSTGDTVSGGWLDVSSTLITLKQTNANNINENGSDFINYCFTEVDGFSKFGSYTGNGSSNIIETGFEPAFIMFKRTDAANNWLILDNKRNTSNPRNCLLIPNSGSAEDCTDAAYNVNFLSNGFELLSNGTSINDSGGTYIYMAFAADPDTEAPTLADSFAVKTYTGNGSTNEIDGLGFQPNLVWLKIRDASSNHVLIDSIRGVQKYIGSNTTDAEATSTDQFTSFDTDGFTLGANAGAGGNTNQNGNDYVAWAWKADDNEPTIEGGAAKAVYKFEDNANDVTGDYNGTASNVSYSSSGKFNKAADFSTGGANIAIGSPIPNTDTAVSVSAWIYLNTDATSYETVIGAGSATASSEAPFRVNVRYVSANTYKIEALRQIAGTYYNTALSNYTDSSMPVETWHHVVWTYHPAGRTLTTYLNGSKVDTLSMGSTGSSVNDSTSVIGNFRNDTTADNFSGLIDQVRIYSGKLEDEQVSQLYAETSSDNDDLTLGGPPETIISANANAGFSIIKYTGDGQNGNSIPHGLSATPTFWIIKQLTGTQVWLVGSDQLSASDNYLILNQTNAETTNAPNIWSVDSTKITFDTSYAGTNNSGDEYIMYAFHSVSGFSKFGSYAGNGTTQTINVGFQPDFVMIKAYTNSTAYTSWIIFDSVRYGSSSDTNPIYANLNAAEGTRGNGSGDGDVLEISFTSTGFKIGDSGSNNASDEMNDANNDYIYWATKIN